MKLKTYHSKSWIFVKKDVICYLGLLVFLDITLANANISSHIAKCCTAGTNYAKKLGHCNDQDYEVTTIPPLWRGLCLSALGLCCSREEEHLHCIAGREAANMGSKCDGDGKYNTAAYTSCCKSCQIGLAVSAGGNNCSDTITDFFAKDESYTICCNHARSVAVAEIEAEADEEGTLVLANDEDICEKFGVGKLCEQICENTKSSYVCKCNKGYQLNENRVTCSKIPTVDEYDTDDDDDLLEEEEPETPSKCLRGFEKDKITGECKDIDECAKGTTSCLDHEYCSNTPGSYKCIFVKTSHCQRGYRFNTNTEECDDINECLEETHNCKKADETCFNTRGSYTCESRFLKKCEDGFIFSAETGKCEDYGLTEDNLGRTDSNGKAEKCASGFRLKHGKCIDIDECLTDKNACDSNQICTNDIGGYRCDCKIGFNMDTTMNACVDVNECVINNHKCLPTQRCDNSIGSYHCVRLQSCGTGYTLNSELGICEDDDECKLRIDTCTAGFECRNTKGSFRCDRKRTTTTTTTTLATTTTTTPVPTTSTIPNGFVDQSQGQGQSYNYPTYVSSQTYSQLQRSIPNYRPKKYSGGTDLPCGLGFHRNHVGACVDINECQIPSTCGTHQRCLNTNGSYRCENRLKCRGGFKSSPDGTACVDIDECSTGEHNCVNNQNCINRSGGFICTCPAGHKLDSNNRCVDVNECEQDKPPVCPMTSTCLNTIGSFYCECKNGFKKNHANCIDVDECQEIPGLCQQKCLNFWGGYRCTCNPGYDLSVDNRTCSDIDECEVHKSYALCMGICVNVPGSYICSCPRGYQLSQDNRSCVDINECETGNYCTGRHDICTNIRGSYRCTTIRCPYGYVNDAEQKNRCRLANNICEGDECFNKPSSYSYNFITLVSKLPIVPEGRVLFTLRGPDWYENIDFDLKIVRIQAAANIEKATENHFSTRKLGHQVELSLTRELEGPTDIELELSMTVFMNGQPRGKSVAKIFIIVSQYTF
ncbi:fibrillin-1 [Episyrphus balteatus]|uniref:fibrillin-1 n=1 Tax=Episyrphus balteatus TaxID=286459 RepID=UPI0024861365|nr:fibrillin-1 [Episyrphus balteatus]